LTATQFSSARAAEDELQIRVFDQPVDFIEQIRDFLDFIQDYCLSPRRVAHQGKALFPEQGRLMQQPTIFVREEEIVAAGVWKAFAQQRAFTGLARTPEKAA